MLKLFSDFHNQLTTLMWEESNIVRYLKMICSSLEAAAANTFNSFTFPDALSCTHFQQVKWPDGKRFEDHFVATLKKYGYKGSYMSEDWLKQPVFIQSFAPTSLIYISNQTNLPKIFLIDDVTVPTQDTNQVSPFSVVF